LCAGSREAVDGRATVPQRGVADTHRSVGDDDDDGVVIMMMIMMMINLMMIVI